MSATTAKIAARDAKNTGITPAVARELYDQLGRSRIAIVELTSTEHTIDIEGKQSVKLEVSFVETTEDPKIDEFLRTLAQAFYRERNPQKPIDSIDDTQPTAQELLDQGKSILEDINA